MEEDDQTSHPPESLPSGLNRMIHTLPDGLADHVKQEIDAWDRRGNVRRLWQGDASLWTGADEGSWLGWLRIVEEELASSPLLERLAAEVREEGFSHAVLLGMGGSSLSAEVLRRTFGVLQGHPELHVLDSTDPAQIRTLESGIDLAHTLFVVSSKSGTTPEPELLRRYLRERVSSLLGADRARNHFIAITDPGSPLQEIAVNERVRRIFLGVPSIGGRYSALSHFGMVPAAIMGIDVSRFLRRAEEMVAACAPSAPAGENPGVLLGILLGVLAQRGRDKVTFLASPGIAGLGSWIEQLLAESTGKEGKGIIPVDGEPAGDASSYGSDRLFVSISLGATSNEEDARLLALAEAGHPVVCVTVIEPYTLGQEFFRWEVATAVAGSVLGIHPFNQPDVEASKAATRRLIQEYETLGAFPSGEPILEDGRVSLFADQRNAKEISGQVGGRSLVASMGAHFRRLREGDYFAILAYIGRNKACEELFHEIRRLVRDRNRVATCLGFGPRFLHSTGQVYKGGPNKGVFLQITCDDEADLPVPGERLSFGVVKAAQAQGDLEVLSERGRRVLRVHLKGEVMAGLATLAEVMREALT